MYRSPFGANFIPYPYYRKSDRAFVAAATAHRRTIFEGRLMFFAAIAASRAEV
jgi:hypothetical protein